MDSFLIAENGRTMKRSLAFGAAVPHERSGFHARLGLAVWICAAGKEHLHDQIAAEAVRVAKSGVQRCFSGIKRGTVGIRAMFQQKLAEPPVTMEGRSVESEIVAQRVECRALGKQVFEGANVSVGRSPADKRYSVAIGGRSGMAFGQVLENQVGPAIYDFVEQRHDAAL